MRKIEKEMLNAVRNGFNMSKQNTVVSHCDGATRVYLHGNLIYKRAKGIETFTLAGWNSVTTRSRLNALGVGVYQRNFEPFYNGKKILSCGWYNV